MNITTPEINDGEIYAGAIVNPNGNGHHIILLPGDNDDAAWQAQIDWAKSIGGDLPSRLELAHLYAQLKNEFNPEWYWSNEQHASYSGYAWTQLFNDGDQYRSHEYYEFRARAVRRVYFWENDK